MHRSLVQTIVAATTLVLLPTLSTAASISPEIGSQATLAMDSHNVSGLATIVDEDTIRFDDFTYDGGASFVYFYLGVDETDAAFVSGLRIGTLLSGNVFDGTQGPLFVDLPAGETVDGFHAIAVWCERFEANFGSGTFQSVPVPEPTTAVLLIFGTLGFLSCRRF